MRYPSPWPFGCSATERLSCAAVYNGSVIPPIKSNCRYQLQLHSRYQRLAKPTPRGFEPLRAEPNGFRVHPLDRSGTVSAGHCRDLVMVSVCNCCSCNQRPGQLAAMILVMGAHTSTPILRGDDAEAASPAHRLASHSGCTPIDTEGIRAPAGRAQWISSPSP